MTETERSCLSRINQKYEALSDTGSISANDHFFFMESLRALSLISTGDSRNPMTISGPTFDRSERSSFSDRVSIEILIAGPVGGHSRGKVTCKSYKARRKRNNASEERERARRISR